MATPIRRLGIVRPTADTPMLAFTSTSYFFVSVIATNVSESDNATFSVWVIPDGNEALIPSHVAFNLPLNIKDSYETYRFPVMNTDEIMVEASTSSVTFTVVGIDQINEITEV